MGFIFGAVGGAVVGAGIGALSYKMGSGASGNMPDSNTSSKRSQVIRNEASPEFIDAYANQSVSGGGNMVKTGGAVDDVAFQVGLTDDVVVSVNAAKTSSNILGWGKNSAGHLIKHRDALGLSNVSAQQAQKMLPQLRGAANQLLNNANPTLTKVGSWNQVQNARMYISNGKMLVTRSNGEFLTVINKTANKWYNAATHIK